MKQFKLTLVLTVLMSMVGLQAFADWDFSTKVQVDGLYYYLDNDNNHAMVTNVPDGEDKYAGDIVIPASISYNNSNYYVTEIGICSFYNCGGVTSIKVSNEEPMPVGSSAFYGAGNYGSSNSVLLYVPKGSKEKYAANNQWNIFKGIREYASDDIIDFADENVKSICVSHWDTNGDGELSENEAAAATTISNYFANNSSITSFDEFAYFINLESLPGFYMNGFQNCKNLTSITIPYSVKTIDNYCFKDCSKLTTITVCSNDIASREYSNSNNYKTIFGNHLTECIFGDKVTSIGNYAFYECSSLTSVTIGSSVTNIGNYAFLMCTGLTSVTIGSGVTSIGDYAFSGCEGLSSVTIPNSVISIGERAFQGCHGLTSTGLPNSVTTIGDYAFNNCAGLTSVTIPANVTSIGDNAFLSCNSLTSIMVESGNTTYDSRNNCNAIIETASNKLLYGCKNTIIPNSVTGIGDYAFAYFSGLTSVTIPNSVTSIGDYAFSGCHLTSVNIPNSVTSIGDNAFSTSYTTSIIVESGNAKYDSRNNCNAIIETASNTLIVGCKNTVIPNSVTSIGDNAFYGCSGLSSVTIPTSVTSIGGSAFYNSGLTSITIPNSVTSIGSSAFEGCSGLTSVTIGNSVTSIGSGAFAYCSGLTSVTVDINTPLAITANTFSNRANATLYVPVGCKSAYEAADYWKDFKEIVEMAAPTNIVFADANVKAICVAHWDTNSDGELSYDEAAAVTTISDYFANNTSITSFDEFAYFTGVTSIDILAFDGCSQLASITLPEGLAWINWFAFRGCALTSISIPSTVTGINGTFLANCNAIAQITVDNGNTTYDSRNNCNAIIETANNTLITGCKNTNIPNTVTSIGYGAFYGCSGLTSITIPSSVIRIEGGAFHGCTGLTSVTIPSSVTDIDNNTNLFGKCDALTSITVENGNTKYDSRNNCNAIIETSTNTLVAACNNTVIPNDITTIGVAAFEDCTEMTSISIPNSVTGIDYSAFQGCSGLTSITIPNSVTGIFPGAFSACSGLTSMEVESGNPNYDSRNNCNAIIETASNKLVAGCKNTVIPNSVTSIGQYAFAGYSSLTSITIPNSVTSIGHDAFKGCSGLTSVTVDINTPLAITDETFTNRANATLYVPAGSKSAYEAASYWSEFGTIEEMNPGYVTIAMNAGAGKPRSMVGYSSKFGLDFTGITGIKAYIVCGYNFKKEAMLVHVDVVPPYTGFVIKTTNSIYDGEEFVVPTCTDDYYYANLLLPVVESQTIQPTETIDDVEYTNLMVGILNNDQPGFVRVTSPVVSHNKSYLRVPTSLYNSSASARQLGGFGIVFEDDEATGISNLNDNVNDNVDANAPRYNIAGQRVDAGYKGVVIQNGKKILIK